MDWAAGEAHLPPNADTQPATWRGLLSRCLMFGKPAHRDLKLSFPFSAAKHEFNGQLHPPRTSPTLRRKMRRENQSECGPLGPVYWRSDGPEKVIPMAPSGTLFPTLSFSRVRTSSETRVYKGSAFDEDYKKSYTTLRRKAMPGVVRVTKVARQKTKTCTLFGSK